MAGATPSALAAAVRLPLVATETKDSKALSLSMGEFQAKPASSACPSSAGSYQFCEFPAQQPQCRQSLQKSHWFRDIRAIY
jgi:hypothetical protein